VAGAVMHAYGQGAEFWGLVTPHGLLELTAIVVAAGAGLRIGWAVIAPGERTRGAALADEGQRAVTLVIGVAACFVVAGFVEAWVTPSGLPTWARVGVGVALEVAFVAYVVGFGRRLAVEDPLRPARPVEAPRPCPERSEPPGGLHAEVGVGE
jgi:hypothetical protein